MGLVNQEQPRLQVMIALKTCAYCAGTGKLTSQESRVFNGVLYRQPATVRDCEECSGSGIKKGSCE